MTNFRLVTAKVIAGITLALLITLALFVTNNLGGPHVETERALTANFGALESVGGIIAMMVIFVLAVASFVLSLGQASFLVAVLLLAGGIIWIISPMIAIDTDGHFNPYSVSQAGYYVFGLAVIGLGITKWNRNVKGHNGRPEVSITKRSVVIISTITAAAVIGTIVAHLLSV
jgi:hypothetical protein